MVPSFNKCMDPTVQHMDLRNKKWVPRNNKGFQGLTNGSQEITNGSQALTNGFKV